MEKTYKLNDYSALHNTNLERVHGYNIFHGGITPCIDLPHPEIKIIEENLRIPYIDIVGDTKYLDCMIEYKGERYFTHRRFIREIS